MSRQPSAVFGPVHQNVAPGPGKSLLSMIIMTCLYVWHLWY